MPTAKPLHNRGSGYRHVLLKEDKGVLGGVEVEHAMSVPYHVTDALLRQVEEELDGEDIQQMLFLCRDVGSPLNVRELMDYLNETFLLHPTGLAELLYLVNRFDLIRKHLNMARPEVEKLLSTHPRLISDYRVLMIEINGQLEKNDLDSLLFLLKEQLKHGRRVQFKTFLSLAIELETMNLISPEKVDLLESGLINIHRIDLKNKLIKYKQKGHAAPSGLATASGASSSVKGFINPPSTTARSSSQNIRSSNVIHQHKGATQLSVQESGASVSQVGVSGERYIIRNVPVGICLIIDCVGNDAVMLKNTFEFLHFNVKYYMYMKMEALEHTLRDVAKMEEHRHYDIFVCILISRGISDTVFCTDQSFPGFPLDRVKNFFIGDSCPALLGKPKLFFVQSYVVSEAELAYVSSFVEAGRPGDTSTANKEEILRSPKLPSEADILWSHCKLDELELQKSPNSSSSYLRCLSELLCDQKNR
ncbi:hypothetical protein FKM82_015777 [Ascaphus truei]